MAIRYDITIRGPGGCNQNVKSIIFHALEKAGYVAGKVTDEIDGSTFIAEGAIQHHYDDKHEFTLDVIHMPWGG